MVNNGNDQIKGNGKGKGGKGKGTDSASSSSRSSSVDSNATTVTADSLDPRFTMGPQMVALLRVRDSNAVRRIDFDAADSAATVRLQW